MNIDVQIAKMFLKNSSAETEIRLSPAPNVTPRKRPRSCLSLVEFLWGDHLPALVAPVVHHLQLVQLLVVDAVHMRIDHCSGN